MEDPTLDELWKSAEREVKEELGTLPRTDRWAGVRHHEAPDGFQFWTFVAEVDKDTRDALQVSPDEREVADVRWFRLDELPDDLHPGLEWLRDGAGHAETVDQPTQLRTAQLGPEPSGLDDAQPLSAAPPTALAPETPANFAEPLQAGTASDEGDLEPSDIDVDLQVEFVLRGVGAAPGRTFVSSFDIFDPEPTVRRVLLSLSAAKRIRVVGVELFFRDTGEAREVESPNAADAILAEHFGLPAAMAHPVRDFETLVNERMQARLPKAVTEEIPDYEIQQRVDTLAGAAKEGVNSLQRLFRNSKEALAIAEAVTLFTNGHVATVRNPQSYNEELASHDQIENVTLDLYNVPTEREDYARATAIMSRLARMPASQERPLPVLYRGMALPTEAVQQLAVGDVLDLSAVSSWTAHENIASEFAADQQKRRQGLTGVVLTLLHPTRGYDISQLSHYPNEKEVIVGGRVRVTRPFADDGRILVEQMEDTTRQAALLPGLQEAFSLELDKRMRLPRNPAHPPEADPREKKATLARVAAKESAIFVLPLTGDVADAWPSAVVERQGQPHFTLAYVEAAPNGQALTAPETVKQLQDIATEVAARHGPRTVELAPGVAWFTSDSSGEEVAHKRPLGEGASWLGDVARDLRERLRQAGFRLGHGGSFKPHATLGYASTRGPQGAAEALRTAAAPEGAPKLDTIELWRRGPDGENLAPERYPLQGPDPDDDIVVTLPRGKLADWADEGDAAGDAPSGMYYAWHMGGHPPKRAKPGNRVYVVHDGRLIGYAPLQRVEKLPRGGYNLIRGGDAVACTIEEPCNGFRGVKYRWWPRHSERPFPEWRGPEVEARHAALVRRVATQREMPVERVAASVACLVTGGWSWPEAASWVGVRRSAADSPAVGLAERALREEVALPPRAECVRRRLLREG